MASSADFTAGLLSFKLKAKIGSFVSLTLAPKPKKANLLALYFSSIALATSLMAVSTKLGSAVY